jgi:hypothetical protein
MSRAQLGETTGVVAVPARVFARTWRAGTYEGPLAVGVAPALHR